ncbi:MAG TPA: hypothetical protein VHT50_19610 [Mycobacterium sp.]|nr:hypothetical protein [Mycobacterium sp.]
MIELRSRAPLPEKAQDDRSDQRADDRSEDDVDAEQQCPRRGGEGQLADAVHREREVAGHHENPDQPSEQPKESPAVPVAP